MVVGPIYVLMPVVTTGVTPAMYKGTAIGLLGSLGVIGSLTTNACPELL